MCKIYRGVKFENYVLISGIIEMTLFLLFKMFRIDFFSLLIQALQIIITMFISRRFLKLYLTLGKKNVETHVYNYYFYVLVVINGIFIVVSIAMAAITALSNNEGDIGDDYVAYAHDSFSVVVSFLLYCFSLEIRNMIGVSLKDTNKKKEEDYLKSVKVSDSKVGTYLAEDLGSECEKANEIYLKTRIIQLKLIAMANLVTDTFEFVMFTLRLFLLQEDVKHIKYVTFPITLPGYIVFAVQDICFIGSSLLNYITFYYIIRDSYQIEFIPNIEKNLLQEDIDKQVQTQENESITNFLDN